MDLLSMLWLGSALTYTFEALPSLKSTDLPSDVRRKNTLVFASVQFAGCASYFVLTSLALTAAAKSCAYMGLVAVLILVVRGRRRKCP